MLKHKEKKTYTKYDVFRATLKILNISVEQSVSIYHSFVKFVLCIERNLFWNFRSKFWHCHL